MTVLPARHGSCAGSHTFLSQVAHDLLLQIELAGRCPFIGQQPRMDIFITLIGWRTCFKIHMVAIDVHVVFIHPSQPREAIGI